MPVDFQTFAYQPESDRPLNTELLIAELSQRAAGKVYYHLSETAGINTPARIAVVTGVPLADFKKQTEFGRLLGEYLLTDLADRGLEVTELRLGKDISILPLTGEFILTRNPGELASVAPELDYVVVSTFSNTRKTLIIQGRLVSLKDGLIKTSWRQTLPLNREILGLFVPPEPPFTIAVKGIR
ncbi:MAG: hypothetical protein KJ950_16920 [Proteobacteria bacterium]|nr:hypothetical protein [Pseudomonadota bacterium]MBU1688165.1 hypothetical protein [Pseudomonadota bacterium]